MIYFDAAFIAKCYLNEPGAGEVRRAAWAAQGVASCELARVEFASIVRRQQRERNMTAAEAHTTLAEFAEDERDGVWQWLPLHTALVEVARRALERLPAGVYLRTGDALHLACAQLNGFGGIYSNDRHLLAAAAHFQLEGINLLA